MYSNIQDIKNIPLILVEFESQNFPFPPRIGSRVVVSLPLLSYYLTLDIGNDMDQAPCFIKNKQVTSI